MFANQLLKQDGFAQFGDVAQPATGNFLTVLSAVVSPTSRESPSVSPQYPQLIFTSFIGGSVSLASTDPFAAPLINPNVLSTNFDAQAILQSMKDAQTFLAASPWQTDFKPVVWGDLANAKSDSDKISFARKTAVTVNHPAGTAAMSASSAKTGVVDSQLRVKGTQFLRVVDASVFVCLFFLVLITVS